MIPAIPSAPATSMATPSQTAAPPAETIRIPMTPKASPTAITASTTKSPIPAFPITASPHL